MTYDELLEALATRHVTRTDEDGTTHVDIVAELRMVAAGPWSAEFVADLEADGVDVRWLMLRVLVNKLEDQVRQAQKALRND